MSDTIGLFAQSDFNDMVRIFNEGKVRYMVIGGMATNIHGYVRTTNVLDLWVHATPENSICIVQALEKFGVPMIDITAKDFEIEGTIYQIGVPPIRIDIITEIVGVKFEDAYQNMTIMEIDGLKIPVISIIDLITNKKASGRTMDLNDVKHLEVILKNKNQREKQRRENLSRQKP